MSLLSGLHNATLTLVTGPGEPADYDRDAIVGTAKFAGTERVFYKEATDRVTAGAGSDVIVQRTLLVDPGVGVAWTQGDGVTFTTDRGSTESGTVRRIATTGTDDTGWVTRLVLEDA